MDRYNDVDVLNQYKKTIKIPVHIPLTQKMTHFHRNDTNLNNTHISVGEC
jgi:hypothetical protein